MSKIRNLHYLKSFGYEFVDKELPIQEIKSDFMELRKDISVCELCALSKKRKNALVEPFLKQSKLMVLDSFADKNEDESGILLNSRKGKKLLNLIKAVLDLKQDEIYISYVYKCFSGNKNDALALSLCLPYFWAEFRLIKPSVLLILGEDSFINLGFEDFARLRGELWTYKNSWIMPSFDIDFILKNPSYEKEFVKDLNKIKGLL